MCKIRFATIINIIDLLMQNTTIRSVETSMVMGIEKRSINVPIDEV